MRTLITSIFASIARPQLAVVVAVVVVEIVVYVVVEVVVVAVARSGSSNRRAGSLDRWFVVSLAFVDFR